MASESQHLRKWTIFKSRKRAIAGVKCQGRSSWKPKSIGLGLEFLKMFSNNMRIQSREEGSDGFDQVIWEISVKAKELAYMKQKAKEKDFSLGYLMAMYEVVSLMQEEAKSFNIEFKEIGLDGINPDEDLI